MSQSLVAVKDVPADAGFQYDKVSMLRDMIKSILYVSSLKTFIGIYRNLHKNYHDTGSGRIACVTLSADSWLKSLPDAKLY